jgi:radical SAM superfamily enzyme YgiQ (UPF0313 family)
MTRKAGLRPIVQYMYGFPGEDLDSVRATAEFFKKIDHPYIGFTTTPLPGTDLYRQALEKGLIPDEEQYLIDLTSGYNRLEPAVNMTGFDTKEFVQIKKNLMAEVNQAYYRRHPVARLARTAVFLKVVLKMMVSHPLLFIRKVIRKLVKI